MVENMDIINFTSVLNDSHINNISYRILPDDNITDEVFSNGTNATEVPPVVLTNLQKFGQSYEHVHGYIAALVSFFGVVSNVLNIIVLTRRHMVSSTNYLLIALAVADMFKMASYVPYSIYMYIIKRPLPAMGHHKGWIIFVVIHNNFIITCHTIAMWLTVALAIFRYIVVCHHTLGPRLCNLYRAKVTIVAITAAAVLFCIPNYISVEVVKLKHGYWMDRRQMPNSHILHDFNSWLYGVVFKIAPCILLTLLSALLIWAMYKANEKRARLKSQGKRAESERTHEHNRTTAMLVAVVLCFVITELPQGILMLLSGIYGLTFFYAIYAPLGDLMDIFVLINSAVNFILYCIMSRQFRDTFKAIFLQSCVKKVQNSKQNGLHYSTINTQSTRV